MYMIVAFAVVAFAIVSYMLKLSEDEEGQDTDAGDVYSTRMSTREWFAQRYVPCALDVTVIKSIPLVKFSIQTSNDEAAKSSASSSTCAVCLTAFREGEELKVLPPCRHGFHPSCIDPWFETHSTCPICRSEVISSSAKKGAHEEEHAACDKLDHAPVVEIVVAQ